VDRIAALKSGIGESATDTLHALDKIEKEQDLITSLNQRLYGKDVLLFFGRQAISKPPRPCDDEYSFTCKSI